MAAVSDSIEWLRRGRAHQQAGRALDAMACFRRSARLNPAGSDAPYALGEVLWQLGLFNDAITAWRDSARINPGHIAPHFALAEALLSRMESGEAHRHALNVLALSPGDVRARMIAAVAALDLGGDGENADEEVSSLIDAATRQPRLLLVPSLAEPSARVLAAASVDRRRRALNAIVDLLSRDAALLAAPASLLALCCEHVVASPGEVDDAQVRTLLQAAVNRSYAGSEHDELRRVAVLARARSLPEFERLRQSYADLCKQHLASTMPLLWPRRAAGHPLRVIVLAGSQSSPAGEAAVRTLAGLAHADFTLTWVTLLHSPAHMPQAQDDSSRSGSAGAASETLVLRGIPGAINARQLAALDADVVLDLAGMAQPTGALLAQDIARTAVTLSTLDLCNVGPLVDRSLGSVEELAAVLAAMHHDVGSHAAASLKASELSAVWDDAVRTHQRGDRVGALAAYDQLLREEPDFASGHYLRGVALRDGGDAAAARRSFDAAVQAAPRFLEARLAAVHAALFAGDIGAAEALCEQAPPAASAQPGLLRARGAVALKQRKGEVAAELFMQAIMAAPADAEAHYNHGVALQMLHRRDDALRAYQRALLLQPSLIAADFNIGVILQEQGRLDAAIVAFENVIAGDPAHVPAHKALGEALLASRRIEEWFRAFRRFEANCPRALPLAVQALEACPYLADYAGLDRYLDRLRRDDFAPSSETELADCLEELLYLLLYFDVDADMLLGFYRTYDAVVPRVYGEPVPRQKERRPGPVRVGYLSADLRNHVMGKMMWEALRHHDRGNFEIFLYALNDESDEWTERFRELATRFHVIGDRGEREAAALIARDDLDILVDLSTHTRGARPGILAFKPARVQITHVASAGSVGMSAIDFKLTDRFADVPEARAFQIETPLVMDGCVYPYRHIDPAPGHPFRRDALAIPADAIVIGAFVSPLKLSRRCLALWREVLDRVPSALLALSPLSAEMRDVYLRLLQASGIPAQRVVVLPQGRDEAENQARYEVVDFVLDPMPFGGVNGTLEALDMGVPVVTLCGRRHGERTSFSILMNLGVQDTIAHSGGEYVEIAVKLASSPAFAGKVRELIRRGIEHSALTDMRQHARNLERAYMDALSQRCPEVLDTERA